MAKPLSITCPRCGRTSYNPNDVAHRYCGACHAYHVDMITGFEPVPPARPEKGG